MCAKARAFPRDAGDVRHERAVCHGRVAVHMLRRPMEHAPSTVICFVSRQDAVADCRLSPAREDGAALVSTRVVEESAIHYIRGQILARANCAAIAGHCCVFGELAVGHDKPASEAAEQSASGARGIGHESGVRHPDTGMIVAGDATPAPPRYILAEHTPMQIRLRILIV